MKLILIRNAILFTLIIFNCQLVQSQNLEKIAKFFTFYPNKKSHEKDSTLYLQKFIAAPVMTYSPETNLAIGTGAKYLLNLMVVEKR
jgi:hypothetical protein